MKFNNARYLKTSLGTYERALETPNHIYFVNHTESDEYASVKMYDRKMILISDNNFAYESLLEDLEEGVFSWMSKKMKDNLVVKK